MVVQIHAFLTIGSYLSKKLLKMAMRFGELKILSYFCPRNWNVAFRILCRSMDIFRKVALRQ